MATTAALNAVENKIPDVGNLVKKTDYDTKLLDIESKSLLWLLTINLQVKHLMQKQTKNDY